jgi:hypothetical protein
METVYQEVSLDDVLAYFAKSYSSKKHGKLWTHESFVDTSKRKVVFKLTFEDRDAPQTAG